MPEEIMLELKGIVENIVYHNDKNQYTVLEMISAGATVTVVGTFPFISVGEELVVFGAWSKHQSFGEQFKAQIFERKRPATASAMIKYLASGAIKGIGPATANKIVETFGYKALEILENEPERLSVIKGISKSKARAMGAELSRIFGIRELMTYLSAYGVKPEDAVKVWKVYGEGSLAHIQENPYCICDQGVNLSFDIADVIARSIELPGDSGARVRAGIIFVLRHNLSNGHTCIPADKLCETAGKMLGVDVQNAQDELIRLCEGGDLIAQRFGDKDVVFLPDWYQSERYIAGRLTTMLGFPPKALRGTLSDIEEIECRSGMKYAQKQKDAIRAALEQGLVILTGGPGTGKTTTLNAIINILKQRGEKVLLAAPTGRAAKRMSELTGEDAKTIHRMLQVDFSEGDEPVFMRNERNPIKCDALVIDEMSMVDSYLFENLLRAMPLSCRLILVGDSDQLPSVGPGNVLGDLISCGMIPMVALTEIFRQSMESLIVTNAHKIVSGKIPDISRRDGDFFFLEQKTPEGLSELVKSLAVERLPKSYGYSPLSDIQILCPSRKGEAGSVMLNQVLRESVNPKTKSKAEIKIGDTIFRVGDKVMQIKNNYDLPWSKSDNTTGEGVFNGDMGIITHIDRSSAVMYVNMDDREVAYDFENAFSELELAYAITIHKSQGNEFGAVIIPLYKTPQQLCYRNLLYTGITRARELLILVGERQIVYRMVKNDSRMKRYTALKPLIDMVYKNGEVTF